MNAKSVVTFALLLFVGVSLAYLIVQQGGTAPPVTGTDTSEAVTGDESPQTVQSPGQAGGDVPDSVKAPGTAGENPAAETAAENASGEPDRKVLVYYFHRTQRCPTCRAIESYAREAVEEAFPAELESGRVEWQAINLDEPGQSHFADDYQLTFSTLVVVAKDGDSEVSWRNLSDVWSLVRGERAKYDAYVRDAVSEYLGG
jgi:thiol-disulfide isomerase/thioredoxin